MATKVRMNKTPRTVALAKLHETTDHELILSEHPQFEITKGPYNTVTRSLLYAKEQAAPD